MESDQKSSSDNGSDQESDSSGDSTESYTEIYDYDTKKVIKECNLKPTDTDRGMSYWLWARHNKYDEDDIDYDPDLVGKWMLFIPKDEINDAWDSIKQAIKNGHLWQSKVSAMDENQKNHAVMIYTTDYTDIQDVIQVLDYLETSGLKRPEVIRYKADFQTRAGIYPSWIYSSDTIRQTSRPKSYDALIDGYYSSYFLPMAIVLKECELKPTDVDNTVSPWLWVKNNKHWWEDLKLIGKWKLVVPKNEVNNLWIRTKKAVKKGDLWYARVSTNQPDKATHVLMIYTFDYTDKEDVIKTLDFLEKTGIKPPRQTIYYKTDEQSRTKIKSDGKTKNWMYASNNIRPRKKPAPIESGSSKSKNEDQYLSWRRRPDASN